MQAYGPVFARVYDLRWGAFARKLAPSVLGFYQNTAIGQTSKAVLDLCCGTGQLALHFLESGYQVTGLDLSEAMLNYARQKAGTFVQSGQARFVQGDASHFALDARFGLVISTYDALNHLDDETALQGCFQSVTAVLEPGGIFCFDLNTREGLRRWNMIRVDDDPEAMIVTRGVWDGQGGRAYTQLSGFVHLRDGLYERFDQAVHNTFFDMEWVRDALLETGFSRVHFARASDLATPIEEPEKESRVFVIATL